MERVHDYCSRSEEMRKQNSTHRVRLNKPIRAYLGAQTNVIYLKMELNK